MLRRQKATMSVVLHFIEQEQVGSDSAARSCACSACGVATKMPATASHYIYYLLHLVCVSVTERDSTSARSYLVTEELALTSGGLLDRRIDGGTVDTARLDRDALPVLARADADAEKLSLGIVDLRAQHVSWQLPEGTKFADALVWSLTLHDAYARRARDSQAHWQSARPTRCTRRSEQHRPAQATRGR